MSGSLVLTIGPLTATRTYTATNAKLESVIRSAAKEAGYNDSQDPPLDAATDPAQNVADWMVDLLAKHVRALSNAARLNDASTTARASEQDAIDTEGDL
jgi:hypothetical protein